MRRVVTPEIIEITKKLWQEHFSLRQIALVLGISHTSVQLALRLAGCDTSKAATVITDICPICGRQFQRHRKAYRRVTRHFCSTDCYELQLEADRTAKALPYFRKMVKNLPENAVLHRIDMDVSKPPPLYEDPKNILVFASHLDHWKHHQGEKIKPLWAAKRYTFGTRKKAQPKTKPTENERNKVNVQG